MKIKKDNTFDLPKWWFIIPVYLAAWSTVVGLWGYLGGQSAFDAFGLNISAHPFIYGVYGARYVAIAISFWLALFVFRTHKSILLILVGRLVMDVLDTISGFQSGLLELNAANLITPFVMFVGPNLFSIWYLQRASQQNTDAGEK